MEPQQVRPSQTSVTTHCSGDVKLRDISNTSAQVAVTDDSLGKQHACLFKLSLIAMMKAHDWLRAVV